MQTILKNKTKQNCAIHREDTSKSSISVKSPANELPTPLIWRLKMAMDLKKRGDNLGTRIQEVILFLLKFADKQRIRDLQIILVNKSFHRTLKSSHS